MQDVKTTDQLARRESERHDYARPKIAEPENAKHETQARTLLHVRCAFFNGDLQSH